ncbi:TPA: HEAT repeat domain-containing protein [Candidatus Poribacteria bacterium]|jgi:HEAT repeat protein|nr:HEAT repeat domain-containing protein [Candidatus Poribacteria bacterium]HIO46075.1 HEAT repeat domain-containing protein [Candidatus Poribacteria bacterium]
MLIIAGMIAFSAYQEKNHPIDPVPTLIQLLQDQNEWVRRNAAIALGNIGMRNAVPALTQALQDEVVYVRYYTAEALGKIGTPEAINAMPALKIASPTRSNRRRRL